MALSLDEWGSLHKLATSRWVEAHVAMSSYERDYRRNRRVGEWLRRGTLCAAVVTAVSPAIASPTSRPLLTTISSVLTALLAAAEQLYTPEKRAQTCWECRSALHEIEQQLISAAVGLRGVEDFPSGMKLFEQISARFTTATKVPFEASPHDHQVAKDALARSVLSQIVPSRETDTEIGNENRSALAPDAPDVIAVVRRKRVSR